jgi:hypothetical protein
MAGMLASRNRRNQKDKLLSRRRRHPFKLRRWQFRQPKRK